MAKMRSAANQQDSSPKQVHRSWKEGHSLPLLLLTHESVSARLTDTASLRLPDSHSCFLTQSYHTLLPFASAISTRRTQNVMLATANQRLPLATRFGLPVGGGPVLPNMTWPPWFCSTQQLGAGRGAPIETHSLGVWAVASRRGIDSRDTRRSCHACYWPARSPEPLHWVGARKAVRWLAVHCRTGLRWLMADGAGVDVDALRVRRAAMRPHSPVSCRCTVGSEM